jgi:hypothetical protein
MKSSPASGSITSALSSKLLTWSQL